jgi:kinesin family protein 18/19
MPGGAQDYLDKVQGRTKEKKYTFDVAYGVEACNQDVYARSIAGLATGVVQGMNGTGDTLPHLL